MSIFAKGFGMINLSHEFTAQEVDTDTFTAQIGSWVRYANCKAPSFICPAGPFGPSGVIAIEWFLERLIISFRAAVPLREEDPLAV